MRFCPSCGTLMTLRREGERVVWVCPSCGHREEHNPSNLQFAVLKHSIRHTEKERIVVVGEQKIETLPKMKGAVCPRCGHDEAYYWLMQTRRADEPPTRFFRCARCGHVWREYD